MIQPRLSMLVLGFDSLPAAIQNFLGIHWLLFFSKINKTSDGSFLFLSMHLNPFVFYPEANLI